MVWRNTDDDGFISSFFYYGKGYIGLLCPLLGNWTASKVIMYHSLLGVLGVPFFLISMNKKCSFFPLHFTWFHIASIRCLIWALLPAPLCLLISGMCTYESRECRSTGLSYFLKF